jgi:hypothetical protein
MSSLVVTPAYQRIRAEAANAFVRVVLVDGDGEPFTPSTTPTVVVTNDSGTTLAIGAVSAIAPAVAGGYQVALTVPPALPATITAVWSVSAVVVARTTHLVVGGRLVNRADLRRRRGVTDKGLWPDLRLDMAIDEADAVTEDCTGVAWFPRHQTFTLSTAEVRWVGGRSVCGYRGIRVPRLRSLRSLTAVTSLGVPYTLPTPIIDGDFIAVAASPDLTITASVIHGADGAPSDLRQAMLTYAAYRMLGESNNISPRATGMSTDSGTISFARQSTKAPTGLPDVDSVLMRHDERIPGIA